MKHVSRWHLVRTVTTIITLLFALGFLEYKRRYMFYVLTEEQVNLS